MDVVTPLLSLLHFGGLPRTEQGLVYALALGPFLVLGLVILLRRPPEELPEGAPEAECDGRDERDPKAGPAQRDR